MALRLVWPGPAGLLNLFHKRIHVHRNKKRLSLLTAFKRQFVYLQKESKQLRLKPREVGPCEQKTILLV
jgi:hypothetical protein